MPAIYSAIHCIDTEEDALSSSLVLSSSFVPLSVKYHCVNAASHLSPDAGPLRLNASVPGRGGIISEVVRCVGWLGGDAVAVTVTPSPILTLAPEAVISVLLRATARREGLEGLKDF